MADDKKKSIITEFKEFISKGNVVDMAVGVIVGSAFTSIVNSLVNDIFTPILGMVLAGINFNNLGIVIPWGNNPYINFGNFIQSIISFLLTAACVFAIVKVMNMMRKEIEKKAEEKKKKEDAGKKAEEEKKEEEAKEAEPPKPTSEELLTEIRDLLKERNS